MRQSMIGLALVTAITVAAQTTFASPRRCCSLDGTCWIGLPETCQSGACPYGDVCVDEPAVPCSRFTTFCRLQSTGECIFAVNNCAAAINCLADPTCLEPTTPAVEEEIEVTWCDADTVEVDEEAPCEE